MFAIAKRAFEGPVARETETYPRFGGRPVRQNACIHALLIALTLVGASAGATLAVVSVAAPTQAEASQAPMGPAVHLPVRTTEKAGRLKPVFRPQTCDGVWGNEPLECLAQTA